MNGKEKLKLALEHREGPLLLDIGGMPTTGVHCIVAEKLREYYGLEKRPIKILEPMQFLAVMDDDLKEAMGIQTTPLWSAGTMFGFRQTDQFKEWRTPWGQEVLVGEGFVTTADEKGNTYIYACGDRDCEPAACLPLTGYYFDNLMRETGFDEDDYDYMDNCEEYGPIAEQDLDWLKTQGDRLKDTGDVVMGNLGGTAFGDIAIVPGPGLRKPKGIRDIAEWYMSTAIRQEELHKIFSYQLKHALANLEKMYAVLGDAVQMAYICGTDFGTQNGPFCSTQVFEELYAPYYRAVNEWIHRNTGWKTFKHTCGSIDPLIPGLIEAGFDVLNPVQWTATGMDRNHLKDAYGDKVVFWGGGVDTQRTLPHGTPAQVRAEVLECCKIFGKNGGFVFNTIHNIQPDVPVENLAALADAVREFNGER